MFGLGKKVVTIKHLDDFIVLRKRFQNEKLIASLWKKKIKQELLFPNNLRKLYFKYLDEYPNLKRGINQAEFKTTIFNKGKKVDEIFEFSISGRKNSLIEKFGNPPKLPPNTIDIIEDYNEFIKFVEGAIDFTGRRRKFDSEIKYIYNFLKNHINKGDEFIIHTSNIFKTCGSCQREFVMLEEYLTSIGKKVKIIVRSDESIIGTKLLKDKLKTR